MHFRALKTSNMRLELRRVREGVVVVQASNDTTTDAYGTIITVEALHQWAEGFLQHRTISQQHNLTMRGIQGKAQVGQALRIDFTPQLEVEIRIDDPEAQRLIDEGLLTGASLEFLPLPEGTQAQEDGTLIYRQLSSEPEMCSLSLCDLPAVPGSSILEMRGMLPNWAYAVVDPAVVNGQITDPQQIQALRYFPHHDPVTHLTDERMLEQALTDIQQGSFAVPEGSTLSRAQIIHRAKTHLARHSSRAMATRSMTAEREKTMNEKTKMWLEARAAQYVAQGDAQTEAEHKAKVDLEAQPALRAQLESSSTIESTPAGNVTVNVNLPAQAQPEVRAAVPADAVPADAAPADAAPADAAPADAASALDEQIQQALENHPVMRSLSRQPENPQAAMAGYGARPRNGLDHEQVLEQVLLRSLVPMMRGERPTAAERQEIDNILGRNGVATRALTIESNGIVIYEEMARQFAVRPQPEVVFRNHMRALPMPGIKKQTFPKFDGSSFGAMWNRSSSVGAGSTAAITNTDGTPTTFDIEVTELNMATLLPESFLAFNAAGTQIVGDVILPQLRLAAQLEEDNKFFLGTGSHPNPSTFNGLKTVSGVTAIVPATNGDAFTLDGILGAMQRAMPVRYRGNPSRLAYYVSVGIGDDIGDIVAARATSGGDTWLQKYANVPGPMPIFEYRSIPVYAIPALPEDEDQGTADNASTAYLVHRDIPVIGDGLTVRIRPYQLPDFVQRLELQEFVGLGYQWPDAIVRRPGILPKA